MKLKNFQGMGPVELKLALLFYHPGKPSVLQSMELQSFTWLSNWTELMYSNHFAVSLWHLIRQRFLDGTQKHES